MDRQTLRDWVHRFNAEGGRAGGPAPGLGVSRVSPRPSWRELAKWVEDGPELATDGVVRWRCVDLRERIGANSAFACTSAPSASC